MSATRLLPAVPGNWNRCLSAFSLCLFLLLVSAGCQKPQPGDSTAKKDDSSASSAEQASSKDAATAEEKTIDPKMVTKPGEPMMAERYQEVKAHLKDIGLALHYSHDKNRSFLPSQEEHPEYYDENGQLKVSWRVHILPFLSQKPLYDQFKLDEAWDSPANAPLAKKMPEVYRSPDTPIGSDKTRFRVFEGQWGKNSRGREAPSTIFPVGKPVSIRNVKDGSSNTVMVVEAGPDKAVEWTRPGGLNLENPKKEFGAAGRGIPVLLADGATLCFKRDIDDSQWKALIGPDDATVVDYREFVIVHTTLKPDQIRVLQQLREIVMAFFNYADKYRRFPPADEHLVDGKPNLSWRVHLLPFMGQETLYLQFKLDEPWDSPHNKALVEKMPAIYQFGSANKPGETRVMTLSGEKTPFPGGPGPRIRDITDGTSNTIFFVIAAADKAVPWTKPEDLPFDPADPVKALGTLTTPVIPAVMMDGSTRGIPVNIPAKSLVNLIQPADGNVITVDLLPYKPE
ncbi:DUF1559 domain-containing protein [Gimesia chilikensis]|nr:DUF1559 domain-containing protein [Gimesia chilikensis]